jgi:hypothetical protein
MIYIKLARHFECYQRDLRMSTGILNAVKLRVFAANGLI